MLRRNAGGRSIEPNRPRAVRYNPFPKSWKSKYPVFKVGSIRTPNFLMVLGFNKGCFYRHLQHNTVTKQLKSRDTEKKKSHACDLRYVRSDEQPLQQERVQGRQEVSSGNLPRLRTGDRSVRRVRQRILLAQLDSRAEPAENAPPDARPSHLRLPRL
jgi:hypothetical protein